MRAVMVLKPGGPEALTVVDVADPVAGRDQLCIRVRASTVNPTDTMRRSGAPAWFPVAPTRPYGLGMEVAGIVDEVGPGVADFAVGDDVMALVIPSSGWGAYADRVVVPAQQVTHAPRNVDFAHAATVPMNGLTAFLALDAIDLRPGEIVAVTGAAGAVGGYVVQLAKTRGLRVIADTSPDDEELIRGFGADWVVPRGKDVAASIRQIVPEGVRLLVDGSLQLSEVLPAVGEGGTIVILRPVDFDLGHARGVYVVVSQAADRSDWLAELRHHIEEGRLTPRVARRFPLADAEAAHRLLERGHIRGRIVLVAEDADEGKS
jgi:NADPH2:quinone reductase